MVMGIFLYRPRVVFTLILLFSVGWGMLSEMNTFISDSTYLLTFNLWLVALSAYLPRVWRTLIKGNNFERYASIVVIVFLLSISLALNSLFRFVSLEFPFQYSSVGMAIVLSVLYFSFQVVRPLEIWPPTKIRFASIPRYPFFSSHLTYFWISAAILFLEGIFSLIPFQGFLLAGLVFLIIHGIAFYSLWYVYWVPRDSVAMWKEFRNRSEEGPAYLPSDLELGFSIQNVEYEISEPLNLPQNEESLQLLLKLAQKDKIKPEIFWSEMEKQLEIFRQNPHDMKNLGRTNLLIQVARRWGLKGRPVKKYILLTLPPLLKKYRLFALLPKYLQDTVYAMFELFYLLSIGDQHWNSIIEYEITSRRYAKQKLPVMSGAHTKVDWKLEWNYRLFFGNKGKELARQDRESMEFPEPPATEWEQDLNLAAIHLFSTFFGQNSRMPWGGSVVYPYEEYDWVRRGFALKEFNEDNYWKILPPTPTSKLNEIPKPTQVPEDLQRDYLESYFREGKTPPLPERRKLLDTGKIDLKTILIIVGGGSAAIIPNLAWENTLVAATFGVLGIMAMVFSVQDIRVGQVLRNQIPIANEFDQQQETFELNPPPFFVGLVWVIVAVWFLL